MNPEQKAAVHQLRMLCLALVAACALLVTALAVVGVAAVSGR